MVARHVHADDLAAVGVHDELHEGAQRRAAQGVAHGLEGGGVDVQVLVARADRARLRHAHGGDLRVGEHGRGDGPVVRLGGLVEHHGLGQRHALHERHGRELHAVDDVAQRPDGGHAGAQVLVHHHLALAAHLHARLLQAQPARVGHATCGHEHLVIVRHLHALALLVGEHHGQLAVGLLADLLRLEARVQVEPRLRVLLRGELDQIVIEPAQGRSRAIRQVDLRAEALEDARELDRDVAAANHGDFVGPLLQLQRVVTRDGVFRARDVQLVRAAAHRDQDVGGSHAPPAHLHGVRVHHAAPPLNQLHLGVVQRVLVRAVQPLQLLALSGQHGAPVVAGRTVRLPPEASRPVERVCVLAGVHHELLGHAAAQHARATHTARAVARLVVKGHLTHCHLGTVAGGEARAAHTTTASTNGDQIELFSFRHG
mmetsp:Transcript_19230/g.48942  ORF Transcript_19230/g.48942 Transcript_19230/m.48942 type:complete len:428 (-) Transcript_19230:235-1518(-)